MFRRKKKSEAAKKAISIINVPKKSGDLFLRVFCCNKSQVLTKTAKAVTNEILYKIANKLFRIVKKILKLLTSRMVIIGVALLLEFCWLAGIVMQLNEKSVYINYAVTILSLIAVLSIINNPKMNPGYKLMWAVCILALPVTGICLYGILGHSSAGKNSVHITIQFCFRRERS